MTTRHLATIAAATLLLGALAPISPAGAADATLTGKLSGLDGPESGLVIGWVEADDFSNVGTTTSGDAGEYSLDIPDDIGDFFLYTNFVVNSDGGGDPLDLDYTGEFFGDSGERDFLRQGVTPYPAPPDGPLDITLTPAGSVAGTSAALAGGSITVRNLGGHHVADTAIDDQGDFEVSGLVPGRYRVSAGLEGATARYQTPPFTIVAGETTGVVVEDVAAAIGGVVKNGSRPLRDVYVEVYDSIYTQNPIDEIDYPVATTSTDRAGRYSFSGLAPGDYTVWFRPFSRTATGNYVPELLAVPDLDALETRSITTRLASAGIVTGRVKKTAGANFFAVDVYTSSRRLVGSTSGTSSTERFVVSGVPAGKYIVYFRDGKKKFYDSKSITVTAKKSVSVGTRSLKKKTATLAGPVPGTDGGFVRVSWKSHLEGTSTISSDSPFSTGGKYKVTGLVPGTYTVEARPKDFTWTTRSVDVSVGMDRVKLQKGISFGAYSGTALIDGVPIRDATGGWTTSHGDYAYFDGAKQGYFYSTGWPGEAELALFSFANRPLPTRSPYWYDLPDDLKTITLTSGKNTDFGTFELQLNGLPTS